MPEVPVADGLIPAAGDEHPSAHLLHVEEVPYRRIVLRHHLHPADGTNLGALTPILYRPRQKTHNPARSCYDTTYAPPAATFQASSVNPAQVLLRTLQSAGATLWSS